MRRPRHPNHAGALRAQSVELTGPASTTLTPPPARRTGAIVAVGLVAIIVIGMVAVGIAQPEVFVTAVQAFAGGGL